MELKAAVIITVGMVLLATPTLPFPTGAPTSACSSMTPGHGSQSTSTLPYTISVSGTMYNAGDTITVTVSGPNFMGILMQVRKVGTPSTDTVYGTWSSLPANTRLLTCTNTADSVTHDNTNNKQNAVFTWTAPEGVTEDLHVMATVAQARLVWWKGVTSATLTHDASTTTASTTTASTTTASTTTASTTTASTTTASTTTASTTTASTTTVSSVSIHIGPSATSVFMAILVALLTLQFY